MAEAKDSIGWDLNTEADMKPYGKGDKLAVVLRLEMATFSTRRQIGYVGGLPVYTTIEEAREAYPNSEYREIEILEDGSRFPVGSFDQKLETENVTS